MKAARFLAPLTLFEWGAILTYFYASHRIAAFLRPGFRPLVLATGILLLLAALCVLFFPEDEACDDADCGHSHAKLTTGGLLALLILLLPIALAAKISPDSFGRTLIENRGAAETAEDIPGVMSRIETPQPDSAPRPAPVYIGVDEPAASSEPTPVNTKFRSPQNAFNYSASVDVPEAPDYPSNAAMAEQIRRDAALAAKSGKVSVTRRSVDFVPLNERPGVVTAFGTINDILDMSASPLNQDGSSLESKEAGVLSAEVVDLLIAARKPSSMKALDGKTVELIGQCLPAGKKSFKLLRLLMICCAADAQPLAVRVESKETLPDMAWAKVVGRVSFATRDNRIVPLVTAEKVTRIKQPEEPYIY